MGRPATTVDRRPLADIDQVAEYLNVPVKTLRHWRSTGTGPRAALLGKHLRYRWSDVDAWFEQQQRESA